MYLPFRRLPRMHRILQFLLPVYLQLRHLPPICLLP
jgi:hypothetical protein